MNSKLKIGLLKNGMILSYIILKLKQNLQVLKNKAYKKQD